jgi:modulator of FtsH protease
MVSGATLIAMQGGGLYWLVPAILIAFSAALIDAWVLLIEIVR